MSEKARMLSGCLITLLALAGATAQAQDSTTPTCPAVQTGQELREPPVIEAKNHKIETTFKVEMRKQCVPVLNGNTWSNQALDLRTYVYPDPKKPGAWRWGYPGPTLRLRKPSTPTGRGDSLAILLVNNLQPDGGHTCDSACPAGTTCPPDKDLPDAAACAKTDNQYCCCWIDNNQSYPDCFHGDNTTNLHFHGTHVSPQPPQDYVLLELRPKPPLGTAKTDDHPGHPRGDVAYGQYQYRVDPFPWTQAEGTHWYHPHKHGSVALQVANGLPGALLIEGPFDDWLRGYYKGKLAEKLLVLQQIQATTNLYNATAPPPPLLVNGQVSPTVTMQPGEVQRWRFVNATMQVAAQVSLEFPPGVTVRQIAMDGVQFAPENYGRQPLFDPSNPSSFKISPGNRADFLIQAPTQAGSFTVTHRLIGEASERTKEKVERRREALKALAGANTTETPLVTLVVAARKQGEKARPVAQGFPTQAQWPKMPPYLRDIPASEVSAKESLTFSMADEKGLPSGPGNPATKFFINNLQYNDDCVNVTTRLGTSDEWTVQNTSALAHPFHIHTNPFQLIQNGSTTYQPPYVWQDTIALPVGKPQQPQSVVLRHRYTEFTGEYVLHCHFLGHEDRGMMFGVQTVCKDDPKSFGKARPNNQPECVPGNLIPAAPQCSTTAAAPAATPAAGHKH